ncbi:hypothetical protein SJ05684_c06480 [Sinorhizobium sojae CCBAU 05684]|uniref:Uncharacterized protein n=1 Tax=Sinorhizobium sojae CCBAU 05684 TaxID=716928 RepID=A0A249P8P5_9HYPH|nr:hypothetical protein SJ05684_c06480 [Sinorhizobium sojae CCBAU 05684]
MPQQRRKLDAIDLKLSRWLCTLCDLSVSRRRASGYALAAKRLKSPSFPDFELE